MCDRTDNQDVGLEAAIIERVRNCSLVKLSCAENVPGLKQTAEATRRRFLIGRAFWKTDPGLPGAADRFVMLIIRRTDVGRGAFHKSVKLCCETRWRYWK
jgi:hypothetical protein